MKQFKTALLATAFAIATTVAFAQANGGASVGTTTGPTRAQPQAGADSNLNVDAAGHKAKVDANAADKAKIKEGKTTGTVGAGVKGD